MPHLSTVIQMKNREKITMLTCYDASFAHICAHAGVDILLVGDSLANVIQGHAHTTYASMTSMIYHTQNVARRAGACLVMSDMPFGSYATPEKAYEHAVQLIQAGANIVKLEGGAYLAPIIQFLHERGIPTCAHLGLMPQFAHQTGLRMQGKEEKQAQQMLEDAQTLEKAGASLLLLECIPAALGERITQSVAIPTIGIGAGNTTDGQVLVLYDVLGVSQNPPSFAKNFLCDGASIREAIQKYVEWVKKTQ